MNIDEEEDYVIDMLKYDREMFSEINVKYRNGEELINVSATALVFMTVVKTLREMIEQLQLILQKDKLITFVHIRRFILLELHFSSLELLLYSAFRAP